MEPAFTFNKEITPDQFKQLQSMQQKLFMVIIDGEDRKRIFELFHDPEGKELHSYKISMDHEYIQPDPVTCKICFVADNTGTGDLDSDVHSGITIGKGKKLYWEITWTKNGHAYVYDRDIRRWVSGDQEITIHFKLQKIKR